MTQRRTREAGAPGPRALVVTDLDGTLLDHHTYRFDPAVPALQALQERGVPVVLCSSKTRAELLALQARLGIAGPFIPENGGAVCLSGGGPLAAAFPDTLGGLPAKVFGTPYPRLRRALEELRGRFGGRLVGFGDVDLDQVARWTGLAPAQAALARQRDFDEPFLWEPEPDEAAVEEARAWLGRRGLRLTRGGRFWHLTGPCDKGLAVRWLLRAAARTWGEAVRSLALGDSENDLPMLVEADEGVLVERGGGGHLSPRPSRVRAVEGRGPVGWARAVLEWVERLDSGAPFG